MITMAMMMLQTCCMDDMPQQEPVDMLYDDDGSEQVQLLLGVVPTTSRRDPEETPTTSRRLPDDSPTESPRHPEGIPTTS